LNDDRKRSGAEPLLGTLRHLRQKRTNTAATLVSVAPAGFLWRIFRCLQAHLPRSL